MPNQTDNQPIPMLRDDHKHEGCNCNGKCKTCRCGKKHGKSESSS